MNSSLDKAINKSTDKQSVEVVVPSTKDENDDNDYIEPETSRYLKEAIQM